MTNELAHPPIAVGQRWRSNGRDSTEFTIIEVINSEVAKVAVRTTNSWGHRDRWYFDAPPSVALLSDTPTVLEEIAAERKRQDERWGADHDDAHNTWDWVDLINLRMRRAVARRYLIEAAAIMVAWIESFDRKNKHIHSFVCECGEKMGDATQEG